MNANYSTAEITATPEYVLELFSDALGGWDQPDDFLTFGTTVADFAADWNDLLWHWRELARALNDFTGFDLFLDEWAPALSPMEERTMADVCRFVATRMQTRPVIRPWPHVTGDCLPAGAFLTARSLLSQFGADANAITPSTPLREYLNRFGPVWVVDLMRLAPGRLPPISIRDPFGRIGCACVAIAFGLLALIPSPLGCVFSLVAFVVWLVSRFLPCRFALGNLRTFRDLAYALAGQQPRRQIQLTA
jgi:hypothetical protein